MTYWYNPSSLIFSLFIFFFLFFSPLIEWDDCEGGEEGANLDSSSIIQDLERRVRDMGTGQSIIFTNKGRKWKSI